MLISGLGIMAFTTDFKSVETHSSEDEVRTYEPVVVLELFTSQGCSSCPSADVLLQKVKKEYPDDVYALSYHVDYWNYIGWEDPFSNPNYSKKQREYNTKFRNKSNYTPQLVVNGREHFVGSNSSKMYSKIDSYKAKKTTNQVELKNISNDGKKVSFDYTVVGSLTNKVVRTLLVLDERTTQVRRGENRNRKLKNSNVVVAERSFAIENAESSMEISIPDIVTDKDKLNLIVLLETNDYDITAAAKQNL